MTTQPHPQIRPRRWSPRRAAAGHTGFNVARFHVTHFFGSLFPLAAGVVFFGRRAAVAFVVVVATVYAAALVWRRIGTRGYAVRPAQMLWYGTVLGLMLGPNLSAHRSTDGTITWPLYPAAAVLLVVTVWAVGGRSAGRVHPVVVVYLLVAVLFPVARSSAAILRRPRVVFGDITDVAPRRSTPSVFSWREFKPGGPFDAYPAASVGDVLIDFTRRRPGSAPSLEILLRDRLPPLEDLVLGGTPGGIGTTSAVGILVGGLFLLYRGLIDYRVPLSMAVAAWLTFLLLPLRMDETAAWRPLVWTAAVDRPAGAGWAVVTTFANYELLAAPLLFTAFFLAGSPMIRPFNRRPRILAAVAMGVLAAVLQFYVSARFGCFVAVVVVGVVGFAFDRRTACTASL